MEFEALLQYIANNGLAVVLCLYMVIHNTKIVSQNTDAIKSLENMLERVLSIKGDI